MIVICWLIGGIVLCLGVLGFALCKACAAAEAEAEANEYE